MDRCFIARALPSVGLFFCLAAFGAAGGEDDLSATLLKGESPAMARRLQAADRLAAEGKWPEALNDYQRIIAEGGDVLVPVTADRRRWVQARRVCQLRLARLQRQAPAALRLYRRRIDDQAQQWLDQGKAGRDVGLLRRVAEEAFCSRPAEEALELLGDFAFERGHLEEAQCWWRLLAPPLRGVQTEGDISPERILEVIGGDLVRAIINEEAGPDLDLVYPDPKPERVARVRAKQLLARLFQGDYYRLDADFQAFKAQHGQAAGPFAGTTGNYAAILQKWIDQHRTGPSFLDRDSWTTFAGTPARNLVQTRPLSPRLAANGWQWSARLDTGTLVNDPPISPAPGPGTARSLAFHPVLAGNLVLWADARYVNAHDLLTGRRVFRYDLLRDGKLDNSVLSDVDLKLPAQAGLAYTLSVAGERAYVRLGAQGLSPPKTPADQKVAVEEKRNSFLVCLDLRPDAEQRQVWMVQSRLLEKEPGLFFEGAPLVRDGRVYVVLSQLEEGLTRSWVECFEAETGKPLWKREVCGTRPGREVSADPRRYPHYLLTMAGPNLVYCSHAGAVVALDARTGRHVWGWRYESRGPQTAEGDPSPRDLAPALFSSGRLFLAPRDTDRLLCLDAESGRPVWDRDGLKIVQLLGATEGRLVFTTPSGIRAMEAATGTDEGGWVQPGDGGRLPSFGRGFLAGGWVYWPTAAQGPSLRALNIADGTQEKDGEELPPELFHRVERGNLVYSNGCLLVAGTERIFVYVPEGRYLPERRAEAARPKAGAAAFYRLALAEMDVGNYESALEHLDRAEKAGGNETFHGAPVRDLAREGRQQLYLDMARLRQDERKWDEASRRYIQAAGSEFPAPARLHSLILHARMWKTARRPIRAVVVWQTVLDDPLLARATVNRLRGSPEHAWTLAATRIRDLIRQHGREVYAPVEKRAKELLASAEGVERRENLERLARQFPNASVTGPALLELAREQEKAGHPALAARAYRRLLRWGDPTTLPAESFALARAGLARAYEQQHAWKAARRAWQELADRDGDRTLAALDGSCTVRTFVARQLRKPAYQLNTSPSLDLAIPLTRSWPPAFPNEGPPAGRLLVLQDQPLSSAGKGFFLQVRGAAPEVLLSCRDPCDGKLRWEVRLAWAPNWACCQGGLILVAGSRGVSCLSLVDGKALWEFDAPGFPVVLLPGGQEDQDLSAFRRAGGRLFFLQGGRRLFALDAQSGRVCWSFWAPAALIRPLYPAGRFNPLFHADERWVVIQTGAGKRLVLDSRNGHLVHEAGAGPTTWPAPPLVLGDGRLGMVLDSRRVALFDPAAGKDLWTYPARLRATSLRSGEPPRLLGSRQVILVLLARNYGYQLERLDPESGAPLWKPAARLLREPLVPGQFALGGNGVYYAGRRLLQARSLADGKLLWSVPLPEGVASWGVKLCGSWIMAYPTAAGAKRKPSDKAFSVLFLDPRDGQLVQKLNFPGGPEGRVQLEPHSLVVEAGGRAWGVKDAGPH